MRLCFEAVHGSNMAAMSMVSLWFSIDESFNPLDKPGWHCRDWTAMMDRKQSSARFRR